MQADRRVIYSAAISSFLLSYIIHNPLLSNHFYSDIVTFWYREFSSPRLPYIEIGFEYPPLAGFLTYFAAIAGSDIATYYTIFSVVILAFYLLLLEIVMRLCAEKHMRFEYVLVFLCLSPSILLYSIYNFDLIFISLLMASLYLLLRGRLNLSAFTLSAAALIKLVNLITLPFVLTYIDGWRQRIKYLIISIGFFAVVNLALQAINPSFIDETYVYHLRWGLENAWFLVFFPEKWSWNTAKLFSLLLLCYGLLKVYILDQVDILRRIFMVLSVFLLSTYVFTPQMILWILPFLAVFGSLPLQYFALELANAGILLLWFDSPEPLKLGSPQQLFALLRAVMLFLIFVEVYIDSRGRKVG